ncbi:hypothetical protein M409DRAFT_64420 [Zasmidium cellare ATCC 36951]|uniref:NAD(P)-binding domain-containing protein n=1 Tax=Zasmidium cellare ATCC 36951 TaxID=1080233 RepID=A0A6A6CW64_ZASCE|nr:uncharacterized protein M409DRAFT_64420 [Zasmidium cellare ATCC 36951]KAF2170039.1 hypothetical protein M409DRAFT_64420 [Zasmidium cellare ATCC 36951]
MAQQFANKQPPGFRNHIQNIAIVGAGGSVGKFITEALLSQGKHKVTAITRQDSDSVLPQGIHHIKKVDYSSQQSLVDALKGQDALVITLKPMSPPDTQHNLMDAAVEAGVEYIMPNEYGVDASNKALAEETMVGTAVREARAYVEKIGNGKTFWVGLVCGFWYEFSLAGKENRYGFDLGEKSLTWFDDGETRFTQSTWAQCGRAVASLFALKKLPDNETDRSPTLSQFANAPVYISSFTVSQRDMLASLLRITNDSEANWTFKTESSRDRHADALEKRKQGVLAGFIRTLYTRVMFPGGGGDTSGKVVNEVLGLPVEDLDEATRGAVRLHEEGYFEGRAA